jgi:hypothetical protein
MKKLDELDLPALRALAKKTFFHQIGGKTPASRQQAALERHQVLEMMRKRTDGFVESSSLAVRA